MKKKQSTPSFTEEELLTRLAIQERSLKLFVKEIYENIGQILSLAKIKLNTVDLKKTGDSAEKIREADQLISRAIRDLRSLAKQLSPDEIIKKGFADAISFELDRLEKAGVCTPDFKSEGVYYKLDAARELIIFGIIQGLICKILTRGNTKELQIEVSYLPEQIVINTKFKVAEKDMPAFIDELTATNIFIHGKDIVHGDIQTTNKGDEGMIHLTIKKE
jgi:two-component system, NarL family, sensor kinase